MRDLLAFRDTLARRISHVIFNADLRCQFFVQRTDSMKPILLRLVACSLIVFTLLLGTPAPSQVDLPINVDELPINLPDNLTQDPLTSSDAAKIDNITSSIKASEWLGPLAPIAISPFFGITILAGISQFGGSWVENSFISDNPVLSNPAVFWVFLCLTIMTSLPRFTKVSKPAAQAIDQLEAYAGIITIVLIRLVTSVSDGAMGSIDATAMVVEMGVFTMGADVLLSLAAIVNIFVINTVKFFFEVMVWLIPFPMVDAALEVTNKSLCAGLMAIYAWSPIAATILNLIIFVGCLFAFRWINRRVQYMRSVLCDPIWNLIRPGYGIPSRKELVVFPQTGMAGFRAKTKLLLQPTDNGWQLVQPRWFLPPKIELLSRASYQLEMQTGMLLNSIKVSGDQNDKLLFSKRYARHLGELAQLINVRESDATFEVDLRADFSQA